MSPLAITGIFDGLFDARNCLVFSLALVATCARSPVNCERLDSGFLGNAGNTWRIAMFGIPAGTEFQRNRNVDGGHDSRKYARDELLVLAAAPIRQLSCRLSWPGIPY